MQILFSHLRKQFPFLRIVIFAVLLPVVGVYIVLAVQPFVPVSVLLRDANAEAYDLQGNAMFYQGAISNIGILLWWTATSVCAFAAFLLPNISEGRGEGLAKAFLIYLAIFSGLLALDDLFMLHENVLPLRLGISELALYAVYGVLAASLVGFVQLLLETDFVLLGLAFSFFAFSVLIDQGMLRFLFGLRDPAGLVTEDLTKMLGIICWLIFSLRTAFQLLKSQKEVREPLYSKRARKTAVVKAGRPEQKHGL